MKTKFIQRVHSFNDVENFISNTVKRSEWCINMEKYKRAGFNLNFFYRCSRRYA